MRNLAAYLQSTEQTPWNHSSGSSGSSAKGDDTILLTSARARSPPWARGPGRARRLSRRRARTWPLMPPWLEPRPVETGLDHTASGKLRRPTPALAR
ncbi:hypothetical protein PCL_04874 [Purpureocillium lilacinum]|uniref:Uncharacterized protein n=2 Tax=Purpureocillium lilacinum TaxID=33203 RepID=A0A2U3DWX2_PURLI|nr:hypothetical protein Purlil1_11752 [Purpureocillium lilacinum]PWI66736.1 hypothetical protein PCL_04874 [Purpureocillium lilacinum]